MRKIGMIFFVGVISTMLYACGISANESPYKLVEAEDIKVESTENRTTDVEVATIETVDIETTVETAKAETLEVEQVKEGQSTYEYDLTNNTITINGTAYDVATNEMDYYGGYMFYYMGNSDMENIMLAVNNQDLSKKYWRENFTEELLDKAKESTELEEFIEKDGEILNFYILNSQDFLHSYYEVEMPIVVEYSMNGEIYNTILVFCMSAYTEEEQVVYRTTDILQRENLDEWGIE